MKRALLIVAMVAAAAAPRAAFAQADNSNAIIDAEASREAIQARDSPTAPHAMPAWLRDEARRRERPHPLADGLTAEEMGLLYGAEFATGSTIADWPALPSP